MTAGNASGINDGASAIVVMQALKEVVADLTLENRLLKKSMIADGGDEA